MPKARDGGGAGRGDAKDLPLLFLRVGAAVTLSIAGLLFSRRQRPPRQLLLPPPPPPSSESDDAHGMKAGRGLKEELRILRNEDTGAKIISGNSVHTTTTTALVPLRHKCRNLDDDEGYLLPEFNEMVLKEFGRDVDNITTTPAPRVREDASNEHKIYKLRDLVKSLQESEKKLELQLLECYGLQEQDAAVKELENQLKISNVELKLYSLKIESLQSENQRLQTQLSDNSKIISELEATKAKCKLLKKKLILDAEQAKEKISSLQKMVDSLQRKETNERKDNAEVEKKLKRLEEMEHEARELKAMNSRLQQENAHLTRRLELTRLTPVPMPNKDSMEVKALEEADRLRQENEKLAKEVEQLQGDRFANVEELVYLKWINACLRYELRNKDAPSGKTVARDLSKTLSPKSELKAKQLIMEYAYASGDESHLGHIECGSECSSSRASSGDPDDASMDSTSMIKQKNPKKKKFFSKLRKLVLGKGKENHDVHTLERRVSISSCSFDDFDGRDSHDSYSSFIAETNIPGSRQHDDHSFGMHSLDSAKSSPLSTETGDEKRDHSGVKSVSFREERSGGFGHSARFDSGQAIPEDAAIHKFADALITSRTGSMSSRRSSSFPH
ncbi:protein CHUP1, chloroplastic-like [Phragmites australis]|uniref:protein CHUP1, chloroplastic-like n=1 Tax=Phragmites australis TaxID=29695 RepID=UPI002D798CB9|nr:protein CHUP1, chloroplastic-like [Phragmites australis]